MSTETSASDSTDSTTISELKETRRLLGGVSALLIMSLAFIMLYLAGAITTVMARYAGLLMFAAGLLIVVVLVGRDLAEDITA